MKFWSNKWKGSKSPTKQRKYAENGPLHKRGILLSVNLSKELRTKYGTRNIRLKVGDKVKILRGQFKKKEGKIEKISIKLMKVFITGIDQIKVDGSKALYPLHPSNLMITSLDLTDKKREKSLERKNKNNTQEVKQK